MGVRETVASREDAEGDAPPASFGLEVADVPIHTPLGEHGVRGARRNPQGATVPAELRMKHFC